MRIDLPEEFHERPMEHVGKVYAPRIVGPAGVYGTAPYQHSKLSLRELEGARYRTALINGCNTCTEFRGARDFPGMFAGFDGDLENSVWSHGPAPDEEFYENVENWRDWPGYSERERLAIRYAEGMGIAPREIAHDEEFWTRAKAAFSDEELVDMTYSIGAWMANGRALHVLGLDAVCAWTPASEAA
jgi:hypothetical protein